MKRTCNGCVARALDTCELGYLVRTSGPWPRIRCQPVEECPKPLTIKKYILLPRADPHRRARLELPPAQAAQEREGARDIHKDMAQPKREYKEQEKA